VTVSIIFFLRFFTFIFAVFLPDFIILYHSGTIIQVSSKLWMFLISTPHKTKTFTVWLALAANIKETVFAAVKLRIEKLKKNCRKTANINVKTVVL